MTGTSGSAPTTNFAYRDPGFDPWGEAVLRGLEGAITFYAELRVAVPQHTVFLAAMDTLADKLRGIGGFVHLALKQLSGDSTMVKNYPEGYKGILATAYLDGVRDGTQPYCYSLFVRFTDAAAAIGSGFGETFAAQVEPLLHAGSSPQAPELIPYRATFQTVAAGDREGIYTTPEDIAEFLRRPVDTPERETVTVENHVMIYDANRADWEPKVVTLLEVAQDTYQPEEALNGVGEAGGRDNRLYRKALTTEILRNAHPDGDLRAYLLHGVWESVWDHENSHIDPRFLTAAGPVGAAVVVGPVEPFYLTRRLILAG